MLRLITQTNRPSLQIVVLAAAIICAAILGLGVSYFTTYTLLLAGVLFAAAAAWYMVRYPHLTITIFWLLFTVQATVFSDFIVQGLYYPIYMLMLFNVLLALGLGHLKIPWFPISLYLLFLVIILQSLFAIAGVIDIDFDVAQKLFIYGLGALVAFQFRTEDALSQFAWGQMVAAIIISIWVISSAAEVGFAGRGSVGVNENVVSAIISLGILPMVTRIISARTAWYSKLMFVAFMLLPAYALLILASRGGIIALAMALFVIFSRIVFDPKRYLYIVFGGLIAVVALSSLPGSNNIFIRFADSDLSSLNSRLPLWEAAFATISSATPFNLFFGHGLDSSRLVAGTVFGQPDSIHNAYLQILVEYGLLGTLAFLGIHFYTFFRVWRFDDEKSLQALGTVTALLFFNLTGTTPDSFIYWIALGFALAVSMVKTNTEPDALEAPPIPSTPLADDRKTALL